LSLTLDWPTNFSDGKPQAVTIEGRAVLLADADVLLRRIGHEPAFTADVLANDGKHLSDAKAVNVEASGSAAALNQRHDDILVRRTTGLFMTRLLTDVGFVHLYGFASAAHWG
jgi:hypothetical protein